MIKRLNNRLTNELRPITFSFDEFSTTSPSILFCQGNTKILCSATLSSGVPRFLRDKGQGWLTAEYALLPTATATRSPRESSSCKKNGRSIEISRLIGRALRTVVNLSQLGEYTINIDCDILQADGSTRVAAITAASMVLHHAQRQWMKKKIIKNHFIKQHLLALSVGKADDTILLDIDYKEDVFINADFNFILTDDNSIIEINGGAEKTSISQADFTKIYDMAFYGAKQLKKITVIDDDILLETLPCKLLKNKKTLSNSLT